MIYNLKEPPVIKNTLAAAEEVFGATHYDLKRRCRQEPLASIRAIVAITLHDQWLNVISIANVLDRGRHSVIYYLSQHEGRMTADKSYRESYNALKDRMEEKYGN